MTTKGSRTGGKYRFNGLSVTIERFTLQWPGRATNLQLTRYDEKGWRATFYRTGMEHSPTSATGTAWERTPRHATRRAAWEALRRASADA
jgi:hypothetical protein